MKKKILFLITEDWFFCSHFLERAVAARAAGCEVVVVTRERNHGARIRAAGLRLVPIEFQRRRIHPLRELGFLRVLRRIYADERPDLVHHVAAKPIFYGTLVARSLGISVVINAPVGMGYVFSSSDTTARALRPLIRLGYRLLLNPRGSRVIFENGQDLNAFVKSGAVHHAAAVLIRGAGVDLLEFQPRDPAPGVPVVALIARMLRDKGVLEFIGAARQLHAAGVIARFVLIGDRDPSNPASIDVETLEACDGSNGLEWWGWRSDVADILRQAHIVCLPSYREGLPKSLLEAAASGLPIVTTNTVGCQDVVENGVNGFLVPVKTVAPLAAALEALISDPELRRTMGKRGRLLVEKEFSSERVIKETLAVYSQMLQVSMLAGQAHPT